MEDFIRSTVVTHEIMDILIGSAAFRFSGEDKMNLKTFLSPHLIQTLIRRSRQL